MPGYFYPCLPALCHNVNTKLSAELSIVVGKQMDRPFRFHNLREKNRVALAPPYLTKTTLVCCGDCFCFRTLLDFLLQDFYSFF